MENDTKDNAENKPENTPGRVIDKKVLEERRKKRIRNRRIAAAAVVLFVIVLTVILLAVFGVFKKLKRNDPDRELKAVVTEVDYTPRGGYRMSAVEDCVIIYDENGVTGIDTEGKWKWNSTLSAYDPVFSGHGDVVLVTDQGGKSIWAFDRNGFLWRHITETPIICAYVTDHSARSGDSGTSCDIIALCEQEDFESSVTLFRQANGKLSEVFTRKFGKYHMLAAQEVRDGTQLAVSGVYSEGGNLSGATVFIRSSDGEVYSTVLSDGNVYLQLRYLNDGTLFAANSESLTLMRKLPSVSGSGDTEKEIWTRNGGRKMIVDTGVIGGDRLAAAFSDDNVTDGGGVSEVRFYDRSGEVTGTAAVSGRIRSMEVTGSRVCVCTDNSVFLINGGGTVIGCSEFVSNVLGASFMDDNTVAVNTGSGLYIVSFTDE